VDAFFCNKRGNIQEEGTAITERNTIIEREGTFKLNYGRKKWNARENRRRGREINIYTWKTSWFFIDCIYPY